METGAKAVLARTIILEGSIVEWAGAFYQAKKSEGVSAFTLRFYKQQLSHFLRYCEGQVITRIEEVSPNVIRQFLLWHEETGHNAGGLHAAYRVLRTFLRWYENEVEPEGANGVRWKNPIRKIKAPRIGTEPLEPADLNSVKAMLAVCDKTFLGLRDQAILLALLDSGVRAREALAINLEDINLISGAILIRSGKGHKPRVVYLGKASRKAVRAYLRNREDDSPALWIGQSGERLSYTGLRAILVRRAKEAGAIAPSLHSFRRLFAISCLRNGVDLHSLATLLGHSDLKTVSRYLKLVEADLQLAHSLGSPVDRML